MSRRRRCACLWLALSLSVVFTGEVAIHDIYSWSWAWPDISCDNQPLDSTQRDGSLSAREGGREDTGILLLADPHIQCRFNRYETWLCRWDSDRYLQRAVSRLLSRLHPHVVVVLGDLFAEGYKADEQDWQDYLECMREILVLPDNTRLVVLPGDNDIGGEGGEGMNSHINKRFVSEFGPFNEVLTFNGVTLVKLDTVSYIHHHPANSEEARTRQEVFSFLSSVADTVGRAPRPLVVVTHVPLSEVEASFRNIILSSLTPDSLFSGHTHHSNNSTHSYTLPHGQERQTEEWTVPTCSYRMGEAHMGAGALFIDHHGKMGYTVLWLPPRYPILALYLLFFLSMTLSLTYLTFCSPSTAI